MNNHPRELQAYKQRVLDYRGRAVPRDYAMRILSENDRPSPLWHWRVLSCSISAQCLHKHKRGHQNTIQWTLSVYIILFRWVSCIYVVLYYFLWMWGRYLSLRVFEIYTIFMTSDIDRWSRDTTHPSRPILNATSWDRASSQTSLLRSSVFRALPQWITLCLSSVCSADSRYHLNLLFSNNIPLWSGGHHRHLYRNR